MAKGQQRDRKREAYWRRLIERWRESGLGVRPFCRREKLSEPSFYAWRRVIVERNREQPPAPQERRQPAFVPMVVRQGPSQESGRQRITVRLRGGRVVHLPGSMAAERLAEILHAIEGRS
jgi:hypothetical protein